MKQKVIGFSTNTEIPPEAVYLSSVLVEDDGSSYRRVWHYFLVTEEE